MIKKIAAAGVMALLTAPSAWADTWYVDVDTRALIGQSGWLDFQFNPADLAAPASSATVTAFSPVAGAAGAPSGDVTGNLGSVLVLGNSQVFNDWLQSYAFGSALRFTVEIKVPVPNNLDSGTAFSLSLYDSSFNSLLADPVWGAALVINATDSGAFEVLAQTAPVSLSASPVPEAVAAWLLLSGLLVVGWLHQRRGSAQVTHA